MSCALPAGTTSSSGRYAVLRIKSDMVFQRLADGAPRKEKYCVQPGRYMGLLLLFDTANGALLAIMLDGLIQKLRAGADSAIGVRLLARADAEVLGILGSGGMARSHVAAVREVRHLRRVNMFSPTPEHRETFAKEIRASGLEALAVDNPEAVFGGVDIVAACTNAIGPVVHGAWLRPGQHLTCIGGTLDAEANTRLDIALRFGNASTPLERSDWSYTDECLTYSDSEGKVAHGGTRRFADPPLVARRTLAEVLSRPDRGRTSSDQITFSERGNIHGVQFAAATGIVYERALAAGLGVDLGANTFLETIRN